MKIATYRASVEDAARLGVIKDDMVLRGDVLRPRIEDEWG